MNHPSQSLRRVLVMHPDPILAMGLRACLAELPGHEVVIAHTDLSGGAADIIVCDEAASRLVPPSLPGVAIVVLARRPRGHEIQSALRRGVLGYVAEGSAPEEIAAAVVTSGQGRRFLCRQSAQEMANDLTCEQLTAREFAVLEQLARGQCNKAIARELDIAIGTVKAHVCSILAKLDAASRTEAASIAMARGFLPDGVRLRQTARPALATARPF